MQIKGNTDRRYAEWQERADHDPDSEPLDWRESRRIEQANERFFRNRKPLTAEQWAILNENPWAELQ